MNAELYKHSSSRQKYSLSKMSSVLVRRDLSGRSLNDFSEVLGEEIYRDGVTTLDISENRLSSLPPSISRLFSNLTTLDLSANGFTELPVEICSLHRLQILQAKRNRMKSLPKDFHKLVCLKKLNLAGNGFEQFPEQLYGLQGLEYLHLGSNHIARITPQIKRMKR